MELRLFTKSALADLENDILHNLEFYNQPEPWVDKYFQKEGKNNFSFFSTIEIPDISLKTGDNKSDFDNACVVYNTLKDILTPVMASDPRLWTYLTHVNFYNYMYARWLKNKKHTVQTISEHFFYSKSKSFVRNGIARLFWIPYLSYSDEFHFTYTKMFFENTELINQCFDCKLGRIRPFVFSTLDCLSKNNITDRSIIRRFYQNLNMRGGVAYFSSFTLDQCRAECEEALNNAVSLTPRDQYSHFN